MRTAADLVVLVDDDGTPVGTADRTGVHDEHTPLHLAFSCYLFDDDGRLLVTRRALAKRTFAGVWTNSFCGHPRPEEPWDHTIDRYARHEVGLAVTQVQMVLPDFRYRAVDASGIVENEICPVFTARTTEAVSANPEEVDDFTWVQPADYVAAARSAPWALSPWSIEQVPGLQSAGVLPRS